MTRSTKSLSNKFNRKLFTITAMVAVVAGFIVFNAQASSATTPPSVTIVKAHPGISNPPRDVLCANVVGTCMTNKVEFIVDGGGAEGVNLTLDLVNSVTYANACHKEISTSTFGVTINDGCGVALSSFTPGKYHWVITATNPDSGQSSTPAESASQLWL